MDEEQLAADEYEKQYYGFSSTELYEDFEEQVCKAVKMTLTEMETAFKEQHVDEALENQKMVELYSIYMDSAKISLQKFKDETKKIFAIPRNITLDEDKYNTDQYSNEDIINLRKEVAELEKELLRERVILAKCKHQKKVIDEIIKPLYEKTNSVIKFLKALPENKEIEKNNKVLEIRKQFIQYYFNNEDKETQSSDVVNVERCFIKKSDNFFNVSK